MESFSGRQLLGASKQVDGSYNRELPRTCLIPLGYVELFANPLLCSAFCCINSAPEHIGSQSPNVATSQINRAAERRCRKIVTLVRIFLAVC